MTDGHWLLVASFTLRDLRLHLSLLPMSNIAHLFIGRVLEGLQRSDYMGIPSLDLSSEPGYF
ncbi:hypothetical protein B9R42_07020 [Arthrospira platensis PCC 7345]